MQKFNKFSLAILAVMFTLGLLGLNGPTVVLAAGPAPVDLLSAGNFTILSKTGITNTGGHTSDITGNIGSSPITAAAMDNVFCSEMTGTIYGVDAAYTGSGATTCFAGNPPLSNKTLVDNAVDDMGTAYTDAAGRPLPDGTELYAGNLGGQTFAPGLYKWSTNVTIPTNVTLSGSASDVWIFQIAGNLSIASATEVILDGGAQASNVFWQVGGPTGATLGTTSTFNGTILSEKQIIIQTGAELNGRALAQTQVTLDANTIEGESHTTPPPIECENLAATGSVTEGNATITVPEGGCSVTVTFASYSHAGTIMPLEDQVLVDSITDTYGPGTHEIGTLDLSCNWQTDLYSGDVQPNLLPPPSGGYTGGAWGLTDGTILYAYDSVENQDCTPGHENPAHLNVIKHVVGGTAVAGDFSITVTGGSALPASFAGSETGTDVSLTPASAYTVVEGSHDGYTVTYSEGCNGTSINEFHPVTCTITNTFNQEHNPPSTNPAQLTVIKHVIGGNSTAAQFTITVTGGSALPASFAGSETGTVVAINPASAYSVTEGAHDGYTVTYSEGCNGTSINEFHPVTCTITNTFDGAGGGGDHPQCSDVIDNADTEDTLADSLDPGCHSDGDASNASSYVPSDNDETNADGIGGGNEFPQCSDSIDNDGDGKIDFGEGKDPGCSSLSDNDETDENNGGGGGGGGSRRSSSGSRVTVPAGEVLGAEAPVPTPEVLAAEIGLPRTGGGNSLMYALILSISGLITILGSVYIARKSRLQN